MAFTVPTTEPQRLAAGDTWQWTKVLADYPASDGWTLRYAFSGPRAFTFDADADGDAYAITRSAAETALPGGTYRWHAYVVSGATRHQVGSGIMVVDQNLASLTAGSAQLTFAERTLAIVEDAIEGRLPTGLEEYQIAGKMVKHIPMPELMKLRNQLRHEVASERNGGKLASVEVTFVHP